MEKVYLNPRGPSHVFYTEKKYDDLIEYVPAPLVELLTAEVKGKNEEIYRLQQTILTLKVALYRYENATAEARRDLKIFHKPGESR